MMETLKTIGLIFFNLVVFFFLFNFFFGVAEASILEQNLPEPSDTIFTGQVGSVASSTAFQGLSNVYHSRFYRPQNFAISGASRFYFLACGNPTSNGVWAYAQNGETYDQQGVNASNLNFCTPTFFDDYKDDYTTWPYFVLPDLSIPENGYFYWRIDGNDFVETGGDEFEWSTGCMGYLSGGPLGVDGNEFQSCVDNIQPYFVITDDINFGTTTPTIDFDTRFTNGVVSGASSSTIEFDIDYILETSEFTPLNRPDYINVTTLANGFFNDQQVNVSQRFILPLTDGAHSKNIQVTDHNFEDGNYVSYVNFWNINNNAIVFNQTGLELSFEVSAGVVISSVVEEVFNGLNLSTQVPTADCSLTNITGCLINGLSYVFIPSGESFSQFTGIWDSISSKPPFGYITSTIGVFEGIEATSTPAFTFGTIPFMDTIFTPFRTLMISLLWFIYAVWFYRKVTKLSI